MITQNKDYVYSGTIDIAEHGNSEESTRQMVISGMQWFDKNPQAKPVFQIIHESYGSSIKDNAEAKELLLAMKKDIPLLTYDMLKTALSHVIYAQKYGWNNYQDILKKE